MVGRIPHHRWAPARARDGSMR